MCCCCREEWAKFGSDFATAERAVAVAEGGYAFAYVEGELTRAIRTGHWLLLDEVNLGPPEVGLAAALHVRPISAACPPEIKNFWGD